MLQWYYIPCVHPIDPDMLCMHNTRRLHTVSKKEQIRCVAAIVSIVCIVDCRCLLCLLLSCLALLTYLAASLNKKRNTNTNVYVWILYYIEGMLQWKPQKQWHTAAGIILVSSPSRLNGMLGDQSCRVQLLFQKVDVLFMITHSKDNHHI